jgi:competence protein ComEA
MGDTGGASETNGAVAESGSVAAGKIDINRANAEQLDGLKGIGPAKAQAIVADREKNGKFQSVDDLLRVKGIGEKLLSSMKESVVALP